MTFMLRTADLFDTLATDLDGTLVRADDPDWDTARQAWHLAVDQRPVAVAHTQSVRDVQCVIATARRLGLRVAPQSTGHNAGPLGPLDDTILLKMAAMRSVHIDPDARLARVEAGALWMDVTPAAAEHGLAALAGSAPDVGVAGYTIGGGLSWFGRSHGLAANSVVGIEVVTADGEVRRVCAEHEAELFWALRGGGGSFGVVTALEFRLYPISEVHAGVLFFPVDRVHEVLEAWRAWLPSVPESVTSVGRVLRFPPLPELPPHLSGQSYVVIEAACQLTADEADTLLAPLRALGPVLDTFCRTPITDLSQLHMDPDGPMPAHGDGMLIGELSADAVAAFARVALETGSLASVELRQLGGALTPGRMTGGAIDGLCASFALFAVGVTPDADAMRAARADVTAVQHAMAPWSTGGAYLNFAERHKSGTALFGAEVYDRLRAVKAVYDPADVIRANHPVPPAVASS